MSDVSREEFDALSTRVSHLEGTPTTPPPTPPTTPEVPATGLTLSVPVVTVTGSSYTVTGTATANEDLVLTYLQIAVRGTGASDLAFNPGRAVVKGQVITLTGTGTGSGTSTAYLAYSVDGTTWVDGPLVTFTLAGDAPDDPTTPTPPPPGTGPGKIKLVGRSGMPFNTMVFRQTPADTDTFGSRRGTPMDGFLLFASRKKWADFRWGYDRGYKAWLDTGRIIVMSMPHAPESEGGAMNSKGASDAYRTEQRDLGKYLAGIGMNVPNFVVRVDWECNGSWYHWSANRPGGAEALRKAITNYVNNLRAGGLTKASFDLCFNKGPSQAGADFSIFPGPEYIDIIGIDQYDMWAPSFTESDWAREMNKPPSVKAVAEFATKHGIQWALDEGGNTHGGKTMGGDNPVYWELMYKTVMQYRENNAWHVTYDDAGAPNTLRHDFTSNPRSWEKYKSLFRPR